jgi:uncharacterized protein YcbX
MVTNALNGPRVAALYRYPVKGLSGEKLSEVDLAVGATFPMDRAFALENGPSGFDPNAPAWQPKIKFLCLMKNARLAALSSRYDDVTGILTIERDGELQATGDLATSGGRLAIERFFEGYIADEKRGAIRLLAATGHSFSDLAQKVVSIINLESLADLERSLGRAIHPLRFRGNLYVKGLAPWSEFKLVGKRLKMGSTELKILKPIVRCAATEVDPETAARDLDVPKALYRHIGESDCGIYAEVVRAGRIAENDKVEILD